MDAQIAVLGAGAWGTAIAKVIAEKQNKVVLWCYEKETANAIRTKHRNPFLPDVELPDGLDATCDIEEAAEGREILIFASPSMYLLETVKRILAVNSIREGKTLIAILTKGFLPTTKGPRLILETLEDYLPGFYQKSLVYIAGPSHAEEVSSGKITGLITASENGKNAIRFRELLKNQRLLVYTSLDVRGVQVAAAAKNVIAIAFGMLDAIKMSGNADMFGDGTESLLLAAGLNEIQTLGMALGATHPETFTSISGIGDLDVTCRSVLGRNRRFGREIIEKKILEPYKNLEDLLARIGELGYLPEGVAAAKYVNILTEKHRLKMPVSSGMHRILNREIEPLDFFESFLNGLGH
ncbi:MAG: NAD(P)-dependent glycerol-3-phosphate dehydrogenase [Treponema sp.]|jgi:glycerol-3-phosphate dehydrogenase (NAD(P)+)|nr:NAD(P)-dependent glycerol-3-phosphate dehydrogenase [Treponema sp.]